MAFHHLAGKILFRSKPPHQLLQLVSFSSTEKVPCPFPTLLNPDCLTKYTTVKETMDLINPTIQPPSISWSQMLSETFVTQASHLAPILSTFTPLAALLAANHVAVMAFLLYKEPGSLMAYSTNVLEKFEKRFWSYRGVTKKYLAGISDNNFNRLCEISSFVFSPAKTMASYKDLFLSEVKLLRNEGIKTQSLNQMEGELPPAVIEYSKPNLMVLRVVIRPCTKEHIQIFVYNKILFVVDQNGKPVGETTILPKYVKSGIARYIARSSLLMEFPTTSVAHMDLIKVEVL